MDLVAVSVISPFEDVRKIIKEDFGDDIYFVYVHASIDSLKERDSKSLYKNADKGIIDNVIGYSDTLKYEIPLNPDLTLNTSSTINPKTNKSKVISFIKQFLINIEIYIAASIQLYDLFQALFNKKKVKKII